MKPDTKQFLRQFLACLLCLILGGGIALGAVWAWMGEDGRTLLSAQHLIAQRFVGDYDETEALHGTLGAMVEGLGDRWSYYLTPDEAKQVREDRENAYVGIGVTVNQEGEGGLEILTVTPGGPADEAGIQAGEIIQGVNGVAVTTENRSDCITAIRGEAGSRVTLTVADANGETRDVTLERKAVHGVTAAWTMLEGDIGLVTIANFYQGTADRVKQGVDELQQQGAKALLFDVRSNPGGYVSELTQILDDLLPEGVIFRTTAYNGKEKEYTSDASCVDLPMAVLVNADSYSAAEFLAAQLQESAGAAVVGEQTSGKGYSQMLFDLPDGSAMGLSTARYFTGGGKSLIGTGLTPDPQLSLTQAQQRDLLMGKLAHEDDAQLQAAIQTLRQE